MAETRVVFTRELVEAVAERRKARGGRTRMYVRKGEDPNSPQHLAERLANGLDAAPEDGCWIWVRSVDTHGYASLKVGRKTAKASRLAFQLAGGVLQPGQFVLHSCDNPRCINPAHLRAGSASDNMVEAVAKGRLRPPVISRPGEASPAAKLTEAEVRTIRELLAEGISQTTIARRYQVDPSSISNIKRGRSWSLVA